MATKKLKSFYDSMRNNLHSPFSGDIHDKLNGRDCFNFSNSPNFIGYKKIYYFDKTRNYKSAIAHLEIDTKNKIIAGEFNASGIPDKFRKLYSREIGKCRTQSAKVLKIVPMKGKGHIKNGISIHDPHFKYEVGKTASVPYFDDRPEMTCTTGIHFYLTLSEARKH